MPGEKWSMTKKKQTTIAKMETGQSGRVIEVSGGRGMQRVEAMGLRPGKRVTKISGIFGRGPITVKLGTTQLALGFGMAQKVTVEVTDK